MNSVYERSEIGSTPVLANVFARYSPKDSRANGKIASHPLEGVMYHVAPVARIETIRPGSVFASDLAQYPVPTLLIGILRGNLSGLLTIDLPGENFMAFRDGVPVAVSLPGLGVSLADILGAAGELDDQSRKVLNQRAVEATESRIVRQSELVPEGVLERAIRSRAKLEAIELFTAGALRFEFREGRKPPSEAVVTILEPLPILFQGLRSMRGERLDRVLEMELGSDHWRRNEYVLTELYPRDVDPFEWGPDVEAQLRNWSEPRALRAFVDSGLEPETASALLAALILTGMAEPLGSNDPTFELEPATADVPSLDVIQESLAPRIVRTSNLPPSQVETTGELVLRPIHRPRAEDAETLELKPVHEAAHAEPTSKDVDARHTSELNQAVAQFKGKDYFEILRVRPTTSLDQLERSYRFLMRDDVSDPAGRLVQGTYREAFETLSDPDRGPKYRKIVELGRPKHQPARASFEAARKMDRVLEAFAADELDEAEVLLDWALSLDAQRRDLAAHRAFLALMRAEEGRRGLVAGLLSQTLATSDPGFGLMPIYRAAVDLASGKGHSMPLPDHPLTAVIRKKLG